MIMPRQFFRYMFIISGVVLFATFDHLGGFPSVVISIAIGAVASWLYLAVRGLIKSEEDSKEQTTMSPAVSPTEPTETCLSCGAAYRARDYREDTLHIYCAACKAELPQMVPETNPLAPAKFISTGFLSASLCVKYSVNAIDRAFKEDRFTENIFESNRQLSSVIHCLESNSLKLAEMSGTIQQELKEIGYEPIQKEIIAIITELRQIAVIQSGSYSSMCAFKPGEEKPAITKCRARLVQVKERVDKLYEDYKASLEPLIAAISQ
jgi:hypothetical protein